MSKIVIKSLTIDGFMSYAKNVTLELDQHRVIQLIGKNGLGKSTIATALEELFYNKNSRGIKKTDLFNWASDKKEYKLSATFTKDDDVYLITKTVKSTAKVDLFKNGEVISGHTATQTYKVLEELLTCDFATFTKLVYQSVGSSLDFLKSTDANRKAFLVNLFDQEQYKETSDRVKTGRKEAASALSNLEGQMAAITKVLSGKDKIQGLQAGIVVPEFDETPLTQELTEIKVKAALAKKAEASKQQYKLLDTAVQAAQTKFLPFENLPAPTPVTDELLKVTRELTVVSTQADSLKKQYYTFKNDASKHECPTCKQHLDTSVAEAAMKRTKEEYDPLYQTRLSLEAELEKLKQTDVQNRQYFLAKDNLDKALSKLEDFKRDVGDFDESVEDINQLNVRIRHIEQEIQEKRAKISLAVEHNKAVDIANAKIEARMEQIEKAEKELDSVSEKLETLQQDVSDLDILITALKDLVGYKLEHSVKVFEEMINHYLSIMTSGKFALGFELDETKLQVVIYNDGNRTSMENCSTGQQSRINISTLLAIRSLLSTISKVNINLLFLDEVVSYIDPDGINTLVELLQSEEQLNSIIVSHGHTHPYAYKIEVKQDNDGLSYLE